MTTSKPTGHATQSKMSENDLAEARMILKKYMAAGLITIRPGIPAKPDHEKKEAYKRMVDTRRRNMLATAEAVPAVEENTP